MKKDTDISELRSRIVKAMNITLERLSAHDENTFGEAISYGIGKIADAVDVQRVSVFRYVFMDGSLKPFYALLWDGKTRSLINEANAVSPDLPAAVAWRECLMRDECVNNYYSGMSDDEQDYLLLAGLKSVLIVPVFIRGALWGNVFFQDTENERLFEEGSMDLMRSVSRIIVNAILRNEAERNLIDESAVNRTLLTRLIRREKVLDALNQTAINFLSQRERVMESQLYRGLESIANFADVDRICIWKREMLSDSPRYTLYRKWSNEHSGLPDTIDEGGIFPFEAFADWDIIFMQDGYINCRVSELPRVRQELIYKYGALSLLIFPVFSREGLWGLVSFDNGHSERLFEQDEVDTMHYASLMVGSVIIRDEESNKAREAEHHAQLMLNATPLCCILWDRNSNLINCNEAAYKLFGLTSKRELQDLLPDCLPEKQPDGSDSVKQGKEHLVKAFSEGGTVFDWMHRYPSDGTALPVEVTLKRLEYRGGYIVAAYSRDLRRIKLLESEAGKIYFDGLTDIYNRRFLDEQLLRVIKTLSRSDGILSMMIVDIDRFKEFNDTYGHIEGDKCLRVIAKTLKNGVTRSDDFVARYGGEEFAVVLPNTDENGARIIAERLINSVCEKLVPHQGSDVTDHVTISVGVTTGKVTYFHNEQDFIKSADSMVYKAKREGRNRYCFKLLE
jgi:diguanylate cyclase (GGDEF)-like protein/PAS domain S-box-containing protein